MVGEATTLDLGLEFRLLGPFEVAAQGRVLEIGSAKQRALLAVLVLRLNRVVALDALAEELWRREPPPSVTKTVQSLVYRLRRAFAAASAEAAGVRLRARGAGYVLEADRLQVDALRFEHLAARGRELALAGATDAAGRALEDALSLWRGPALADLLDLDPARAEATRLDEARLAAVEELAEVELARPRPEKAVQLLEPHVAANPLRERAWAQLMLALYRTGRQADALRAFQRLRTFLAEELGLEPTPELRALEKDILAQSPGLAGSVTRRGRQPTESAVARPPLVGRQAEFGELSEMLERARGGSGALVMVGGEPGVGKTRLAEELMAKAIELDLQVFAGHSYEMEGAAPFIPVVEIIEAALARAPNPVAFRAFLGDEAPEMTRLVPKLRQLFPDIPPPLKLPAEQERRLLFNSVRGVIARAARLRPMLLVFDDLHWADEPTLLLVEHLAAEVERLPLVILATYRDTEVDVGRPLARTFEDLHRRGTGRWLTLERLSEDAVGQVLAGLSGQEAPASLVEAIYSETEGNPFFLVELYRYLGDEGRLFDAEGRFRDDLGTLDVPPSVRLVIGRRLQRLEPDTPAVLAAAAVVGRAFSVEVLEAMGVPGAVDAVEDAARAHLIVAASDPSGEDRFIFAHELIRQTLLADLALTRRRRLHALVADGLERHYPASLDAQAATIAHHLVAAETNVQAERVFHYLIRAARYAMGRAAFEEGLRHYERAAAMSGVGTPAEQAELLFELGTARRSAGQMEGALGAWRQSIDAYEVIGDDAAISRVCWAATENLIWLARLVEAVEMGRRGLTAAGERVTADRARLLGFTGVAVAAAGDYRTGMDLTAEGLALAAALGDDKLLGQALLAKAAAHHIFMELRDTAEAGWRVIELRGTGDLWNLIHATGFLAHALTYLGRYVELQALNDEFGPLAERLGSHGSMLQHRRTAGLTNFFRSGDLHVLEALGTADRELCLRTGMPWASGWSWLGLAQFLRGDWDEALALFHEAVRLEPPSAARGWNASLLFECLAYRGDKAEALALLDERVLPGPGEPKPWGGACMLLAAVEGLTVLGERERAAELYPSVVDVFERTGVISPGYDDGRLYERAAGITALAGRQWEAAEEHFRRALRQAAALPHRIEEAHSRRWYGQTLLERARPGDRQKAEQLLGQAVNAYERMAMPRHRDLSARMLSTPAGR